MRKLILQFITLLCTTLLWSQQEPQYTQYMYNMSVINPAYTTGEQNIINFGALYRTQWVGVVGAPTTANLFAHVPINDKIETNISFVNDQIGNIVNTNNLYADFAYKLNFERHGSLSFGIKTGVTFFDANFNGLDFESGGASTDPYFENINQANFNIGAGIYYNTENYYIGFSVPYILETDHFLESDGNYQHISEAHYYLTGGYVFDLSESVKMKPSFMAKAVKGAPISIDLNANFLFQNRFEVGVGYRFNDAVVGMVNFGITPDLRIGYAYDYTTSDLSAFSYGSHEFILLYNLDRFNLNRGFDKSPRFF